MVRSGLQHPWRYALAAAALGMAAFGGASLYFRSTGEAGEEPLTAAWRFSVACAVTSLVVCWMLRHWIVSARGVRTLWPALTVLILGAASVGFVDTAGLLGWDLINLRESFLFQDLAPGELEPTILFFLIWVPEMALLSAASAAPVLVPLSWISVILLRWASGGTSAPRAALT